MATPLDVFHIIRPAHIRICWGMHSGTVKAFQFLRTKHLCLFEIRCTVCQMLPLSINCLMPKLSNETTLCTKNDLSLSLARFKLWNSFDMLTGKSNINYTIIFSNFLFKFLFFLRFLLLRLVRVSKSDAFYIARRLLLLQLCQHRKNQKPVKNSWLIHYIVWSVNFEQINYKRWHVGLKGSP